MEDQDQARAVQAAEESAVRLGAARWAVVHSGAVRSAVDRLGAGSMEADLLAAAWDRVATQARSAAAFHPQVPLHCRDRSSTRTALNKEE